MISLNSIEVKNFKNIRHAHIALHDVVVITGPGNSGISDLLLVFPFLNFIINGSDEDIHSYFEIGEMPRIGSVINTSGKDEGTVEFKLKFSDAGGESEWLYVLILFWAKGQRDFIKEEKLGVARKDSPNHIDYFFIRNETSVSADKDLAVYLNKVFPESEQSIIRILQNIRAGLVNSEIDKVLMAMDDLLRHRSFYFSGAALKEDLLNAMFGSVTLGQDLQDAIGFLENEGTNWPVFNELLRKLLDIKKVEVHRIGPQQSATDKTTCYGIFTQGGQELFLNQLPESAVNLVTLLTRILLKQHTLFLIEEPEKSINTEHLKFVLEYLSEIGYPGQFIISTNSVPLINAVLPQNIMITVVDENGMYDIENISQIMNKRQTGKGLPPYGNESFFNIGSGDKN